MASEPTAVDGTEVPVSVVFWSDSVGDAFDVAGIPIVVKALGLPSKRTVPLPDGQLQFALFMQQ